MAIYSSIIRGVRENFFAKNRDAYNIIHDFSFDSEKMQIFTFETITKNMQNKEGNDKVKLMLNGLADLPLHYAMKYETLIGKWYKNLFTRIGLTFGTENMVTPSDLKTLVAKMYLKGKETGRMLVAFNNEHGQLMVKIDDYVENLYFIEGVSSEDIKRPSSSKNTDASENSDTSENSDASKNAKKPTLQEILKALIELHGKDKILECLKNFDENGVLIEGSIEVA